MDALDALLPVLYVFCTLFAACVGSFSNVIIYRVPNHMNIAWPPSACPQCGARIKPYDNIPVLSWLLLRGKCRTCKNPISPQYPIVEGICALFGFFLCHQIFDNNLMILAQDGVFLHLFALFIAETLFLIGALALAIIDYETTELPPEIALPLGGLGILLAFFIPETAPYTSILGNISGLDAILGAVIGGGIVVTIIGLYYLATRRIGMGGGDIWMMAMVGGFLGWECLPFIFLAASLQGLIAAVIAILHGKKQQTDTQKGLFRNAVANELDAQVHGETPSLDIAEREPETGKLAIPFGPFIALAAIEYVFFGKYLLPIVSGGVLTPWGFVVF